MEATSLRVEVDNTVGEIREREEEIIHRLTVAAGYKDSDTAFHTKRVGLYSEAIAMEFGLPSELCSDIRLASPMHDIGKVGIPDSVLSKPGKLTEDEFRQVKLHSQIGSEILSESQSSLLRLAAEIAHCHHERWDGRGYPEGLSGKEIPLSGRIVSIADNFNALTSERPYKAAWSLERAVEHIRQNASTHFDPAGVNAFLDALPEVQRIYEMYRSSDEMPKGMNS